MSSDTENETEKTESSESIKEDEEKTEEATAFLALERDYQAVLAELDKNEGLSNFSAEFTRLFEALYASHSNEEKLMEKCQELQAQLAANSSKVAVAMKLQSTDKDTIEQLKQEIETSWKLVDAAHARELSAQEMIEHLRSEVGRLTSEIEQKLKLGLDQTDDFGIVNKKKDAQAREKERLQEELASCKDQIERLLQNEEELERKNNDAELRINELTQELESLASEASKEQKQKERMEDELRLIQSTVEMKEMEITQLTTQLNTSTRNVFKLETSIRDIKASNDRLTRESETYRVRSEKVKLEFEAQCNLNDKLTETIAKQVLEMKVKDEEMARIRLDTAKVGKVHDSLEKKLHNAQVQRNEIEVEREKLKSVCAFQEKEIDMAKKQAEIDARTVENMIRERELLDKNIIKAANTAHDQLKLLKIQETVKGKLEIEIDMYMGESNKQRKIISHLEKERDRLISESLELSQKVQDTVDEVKLKQMAILDYKKKIAEGETKFRMQQNLFEQVRADRNTFSKNLLEAQDEISELKHKLKVTGHQIEQLKEDITTKETQLMREEFALQKTEKEKEILRVDLQKLQQEISECKHQIEDMQKEENKLQKIIKEADEAKMRQKKEMEQIMNERDILGTQLVRRNDELSLLYEKVKILQSTLHKGEAQYDQRLEDIRLLKIEIKGLRQEKAMLCKNVTNMSDLRQEVLHLERDLTRENLKCRALEEELQNPLNVHRWRKLEGTDPKTYELIQKIQILQKRLMAQSSAAIAREQQLQESERLYMNLRQMLIRQPGPDTALRLNRTQAALKDRGVKMRALVAELNMYESQVSEYKLDLERVNQEMKGLKEKYYDQKRRENTQKDKDRKHLPIPKSVSLDGNQPRFTGGGFSLNATPSRLQSVTSTTS